jgi:hypothetical protein
LTRKRKQILSGVLAVGLLYLAGLVWGQCRLAWAAICDLRDRNLVIHATSVTLDRSRSSMSAAQEAYLLRQVHESPTPTTPRIQVSVRWNAYVCARVHAGHYVGPLGAEGKETLFICMFGAWVPVYTFYNVMA